MNDKLQHLFLGLVVGLQFNPVTAIIVTFAVGLGKEIADTEGLGTPDLMDLVWTVSGGMLSNIFKFIF